MKSKVRLLSLFFPLSMLVSGCGGGGGKDMGAGATTQPDGTGSGTMTQADTSTVIASGFSSPSFLTTDGKNLFLSDQFTRTVLKVSPTSGISTVLLQSGGRCTVVLCSPRGVATDGKSVFVADESGSVKKIDLATGNSSDLANGLNLPVGITTDGVHVYVSTANGINKINISTQSNSLLTLGSGQDLTAAGEYLYLLNGNGIQKVNKVTGETSIFAGSSSQIGQLDGVGGESTFQQPIAITSDGTSLYVSQSNPITALPVRKIDIKTATVSTLPVAGAVGLASDGVSLYFVKGTTIRKLPL